LKPQREKPIAINNESPPARGRGLKQSFFNVQRKKNVSPPARGRGLKLIKDIFCSIYICRPPRGGVD